MRYLSNLMALYVVQIILLLALIAESLYPNTFSYFTNQGETVLALVFIGVLLLMFLHLLLQNSWRASQLYVFSNTIAYLLFLWIFLTSDVLSLKLGLSLLVLVLSLIGLIILSRSSRKVRKVIRKVVKQKPLTKVAKKVTKRKTTKKKSEGLIGSSTGTKVHHPSCIVVDRIPKKKRKFFTTLKSAMKQGYTACNVCLPDKK